MKEDTADTLKGLARAEDGRVEIDLVELAALYLENMRAILLGVVVGTLLFWLASRSLITPKYTAVSELYMVSSSEGSIVDFTTLNMGTSLAADYEELIRIHDVGSAVIGQLHLDYDVDELERMFTVSNPTNTRTLKIEVESPDPKESQDIANAIADISQKMLPDKTDTLKPRVVQHAILPETKSSPNNARNAVIGGLLGALLVMAYYGFLFVTDSTFHTGEDIERFFGILPLAEIPESEIPELSDKKEESDRRQMRRRRRRKKGKHGTAETK